MAAIYICGVGSAALAILMGYAKDAQFYKGRAMRRRRLYLPMPWLNARGFSLVGALVSTVIVGIALQAIVRTLHSGFMAERSISSVASLEDLRRRVDLSLRNMEVCNKFVRGKKFNPTPDTLSLELIENLSLKGLDSAVIAAPGMGLGMGLSLVSLNLNGFIKIASDVDGFDRYIATVAMGTSLVQGGQKMRSVTIGVETTSDDPAEAVIVRCFDSNASVAPTPTPTPPSGGDNHNWVAVNCPIAPCPYTGYLCKVCPHGPEEICQRAGYRVASGICKGVYKGSPPLSMPYYGATLSVKAAAWFIACHVGYGPLPVEQISCD